MIVQVSQLRCREVINICTGDRLGFVSDAEFDCPSGNLIALVVPGKLRCFGLLGREADYVIPWGCIRKFGEDIILVDGSRESFRSGRNRRKIRLWTTEK